MNPQTSTWTVPLLEAWSTHFPATPAASYITHAPGRVNLIGEHVDHQAYPVCPCAVSQSLGVAVSVVPKTAENNLLEVASINTAEYPARVFKNAGAIQVGSQKGWTNYVCAAYLGVAEYYLNGKVASAVGKMFDPAVGLSAEQVAASTAEPNSPLNWSVRMLFDGDVPAAAGLSSSAALVVATAMSLTQISGEFAEGSRALADLCANAERYSGVASGGMDQAAVILSLQGSATLIHFKPLETQSVQLPEGGALVIANTCRESPKALLAAKMYNKRVFELKAGCLALLDPEVAKALTTDQLMELQLRDVVREHLHTTEEALLVKLPSLVEDKVWTKADMSAIFGEERRVALLEQRCGMSVWTQNEDFHVYQRIRHVLSEAIRVEQFAATAADQSLDNQAKLERLGELMNGSGASLAMDFDCSCPEIEEIVRIARRHGAYGSRLTGAGWGGCTVSLVPADRVEVVIAAIKSEYFEPIYNKTRVMERPLEALPKDFKDIGQCVFATQPGSGAFVQRL